MTGLQKGPKKLIKSYGRYSHQTIGHGCFTSLKSYEISTFKEIEKIFDFKANND